MADVESGNSSGGSWGLKTKVQKASLKRVVQSLRCCMICNGVFLLLTGFLGVFGFAFGMGFIGVDGTFLCFYLAVFALLIFLADCVRTRKSKPCLRSNFGFLFHYKGRIMFLFFISALALGGREVGLACGIFTIVNMCAHIAVIHWHPELEYDHVVSYSGKAGITTQDVKQHYDENKSTYDSAGRAVNSAVPDSVKESAKREAQKVALQQAKKEVMGKERVMEEGLDGEDEEDGNEMGLFEDDDNEEEEEEEEESSSEEEEDIILRELGNLSITKYEDLDFDRARAVQDGWSLFIESHPPAVGKAISRKERARFELRSTSLVYGEVTFSSVAAIFEKVKKRFGGLNEEDPLSTGVFYDIGSGTGKTVFMAALLHPYFKKACGIEVMNSLYTESLELQFRWETKMRKSKELKNDPCHNVDIEFVNGDATQFSWSDGAFIICNSTCFDEDLMTDLAKQADSMPIGAFLITLTKRIPSENFRLLDFEKMPMSWGNATVYIQKKIK
eukprot:g4962.t1